jgi:hypothetical protein
MTAVTDLIANIQANRGSADSSPLVVDADLMVAALLALSAGSGGGTVPKFSAINAAPQAMTSGAATKIILGTEQFDTNGDFVPGGGATQSRFTCTVPGFYLFQGLMRGASGSSNITDLSLSFFLNGVEYIRVDSVKCPAVAAYACNGSVIINLVATDFVELIGNIIATGPQFDFVSSAVCCQFSGVFLGAGNA